MGLMETPCDLWERGCTTAGYGETFRDGKVRYTHRVAWEDAHGPIPDGLTIHHLCGQRRCRNVEHMELLRRDDHAGALGHGKLTREDARQIKDLVAVKSHGWIAAAYGISRPLVSMIASGRRWAAA